MPSVLEGYRQGPAGLFKESDDSGPYSVSSDGQAALIFDPRLMSGTTRPRLRVDVAETSFFEGREFRTFKEWASATTSAYVIKVVTPINIVLQELSILAEAGSIRIRTISGGTEGGTFSESLPRFPTNTMSEKPQPAYAVQTALTAGGTHDGGGTVLDVLRVKTSGNSNFSESVGMSAAERGVGAGTYYFLLELVEFVGLFKARWEERP